MTVPIFISNLGMINKNGFMKSVTCKLSGVACDQVFQAETFEEMQKWFMSKKAEFEGFPDDE